MAGLILAAVGDMSFSRADVEALNAEHGPGWYFGDVAESLAAADIRFGNLESVLLAEDFPAAKRNPRALAGGEAAWRWLETLKFDVLNQASNHALDCGSVGLANTFKCIADAGAQALGAAPDPAEARALRIVERRGLRVGFLGYLEPCNWVLEGGGGRVSLFNLDWALADIERARPLVDTLVVSYHAGLEFQDGPSIPRVNDCRAMVDAGADVVLCHHPHVPQGVEFHGPGLIAYSLGNFCFPIGDYLRNAGGPHVTRSTVLKIRLSPEGEPVDFSRDSFQIDPETGRPCRMDKPAADEAAANHERLDELVADEQRLRESWYASCLRYLKIEWPKIVAATPESFIDEVGWRLLCLPENRNWTAGVLEMAQQRYADLTDADFEYDRPNAPFEGRRGR